MLKANIKAPPTHIKVAHQRAANAHKRDTLSLLIAVAAIKQGLIHITGVKSSNIQIVPFAYSGTLKYYGTS